MTRGTKVTNKEECNHMKLTYICGSAVHLRNVWRRDILKKIPSAVGAKAGRDTGGGNHFGDR